MSASAATTKPTEKELRAVYRLVADVCLLGHDATAWTHRLMQGLAELFEAKAVGIAWSYLPERPGGYTRSEVQLHYGMTPEEERLFVNGFRGDDGTLQSECLRRIVAIPARFVTVRRQDVMSDDEWYALPEYRRVHEPAGVDANLTSFFVVLSQQRLFGISVHRPTGAPQFTTADRRRLRVLHLELARVWRTRFAAPSGDDSIRKLPERLRQVLWLLCLGRSEKEVAAQLDLSPHTVHNHIRRLHAALRVCTRSELVARALTCPNSASPAMPGREMNRFRPL